MASSNPVFRAACENDLWTRKKTTSAARQMVHRMNNGNLIKTALRVENMPAQPDKRAMSLGFYPDAILQPNFRAALQRALDQASVLSRDWRKHLRTVCTAGMTYSRFLQGGKKGGEFPRRLSATRVSLVSVAAVLPEVTPVRANVAAVGRMPRRS